MINLILFLIAVTCFSMVAAWVAGHPGSVTLYWADWRVDTSAAFLLLALLGAALVIACFLMLLRFLFKAPREWSVKRELKYHRKGLAELTYGVASLAASDIRSAEIHTRKAEKLLGKTPLTILLSAQVAKSQGHDDKTKALLEQLLDYKETEYLAARSLSEAAAKQQLLPRALDLARRAYRVNPKEAASLPAMISLHIRMQQWQEAQHAIDKALRSGHMPRGDANRLRGLALLMQGEAMLAEGRQNEALRYAVMSLKTLRGFPPATLFVAKCHAACGQPDKAIKLLYADWKKFKHPQLAGMIKDLSEHTAKKPLRILQAITGHANDIAALWTCRACGHSQTEWALHCPACDGFDTLS